jgi:hypothetical protein
MTTLKISYWNPLDGIPIDKISFVGVYLTSVRVIYFDEVIRLRKVVKTPYILHELACHPELEKVTRIYSTFDSIFD